MKTRPYKQVDVFAPAPYRAPYRGNPLAVVLDGADLDPVTMQHFARWMNLSETVFLSPPTDPAADYRLRIFTPGSELPFAGHPTLGACHAWLESGGRPKTPGRVVQQCALGRVNLRIDGPVPAFEAPPLQRSAPDSALLAQIARALGIAAAQIRAAQRLDNGPVWLGLLLDDARTVRALTPDHQALKALGQMVGVAAVPTASAAAQTPPADLCVRAFTAPTGIDEDPVTGSLNASLAQWLIADGLMPPRYIAAQGQSVGRDGRVHVLRDDDGRVWIGGASITCIDGQVRL
ncbi:MAG: PhzF family phenazine biosynthesis protein [Burkholderiaceae bacterium]|jgi:PhzF family phenazine biosynthesis protein|nr:PhzF family phenazine biosynthesis protein [Burkholderiaceae bacterium]